jgi:molecular chaperone DnaJ
MATATLGGDIEVPTIDGGRSRVKSLLGQSGRQRTRQRHASPARRWAR